MKKIKAFKLLLSLILIVLLAGCEDKSIEKYTYVANVPIYMSYADMRAAISVTTPQALVNPGKIYFKGGRIYINESFKGIHVIDNSNPSNPQKLAFINIPGNVDIAIKGNILYADSYIDLVAIDISDLNNIKIVKRINDILPQSLPPFNTDYPVAQLDQTKGVVVDWKIEKITETNDLSGQHYYPYRWGGMLEDVTTSSGTKSQTNYFVPNSVGIAGSMAKFMIYQDYLYTINDRNITLFNIANTSDPILGNTVTTTRVIETLFVYNDKLFIGSTTGMLVYNLSNPATPVYMSAFDHMTSCDPVVVEGDYAYVTLRAGNACGNVNNQLDVINIADIYHPYLVKTYSMSGPYGLGIDNGTLFVCDGDAGLKVYDATDPLTIDQNMIKQFANIHAFDIIPFNKVAMMIGEDGLYQYNYSDLNNLILLSTIPIE